MAAEERKGVEGEGIPRFLLSCFNVTGMGDPAMKHIQLMLLTSILRSPPSCGSTLKTLAAYVVTFDLMVPFILWFDSLNAVSLCCYLRSCRALHLWFDYLRARSRSKS